MNLENKSISANGVVRSKKHRAPAESHNTSMTALAVDAGKYYDKFKHVEVELVTLPNGETIECNPVEVDRSLTRKQHLKLWGGHGLLRHGKPISENPTFIREGSKSCKRRVTESKRGPENN